jgi:hypothetical protein
VIRTAHQMGFAGDQIKKNYIDGARSLYGAEERVVHGLGDETRSNETVWKKRA